MSKSKWRKKLVVNEKVVNMKEFLTKFTVFHKNVLITLQIKLRQKKKEGGSDPSPWLRHWRDPLVMCS